MKWVKSCGVLKCLNRYLLGTGLQIPPAAQQALQMSNSMVAMAAATGQFLLFYVHVLSFIHLFLGVLYLKSIFSFSCYEPWIEF